MDWNTKLLELAENGQVAWEEIARECIAQMSVDDAEDVATALGLDEDDFTDDLAEDEDDEELADGWVKCCKCGAKLNKDIDTYRFTSDGEPICYDCAEDSDEDEVVESVQTTGNAWIDYLIDG